MQATRADAGSFANWTVNLTLSLAAAGWLAISWPAAAQQPAADANAAGRPLPRFVSLKSDEVNLRSGPGRDYPTQWVYRRAGLPLEVIKEFEGWRQVRDAEGAEGWIQQSLLSGRRTALIQPWDVKQGAAAPQIPLRSDDSESAKAVAIVEAGVIANVHACDTRWCEVTVEQYRGYVEQKKLWGIYEGEVLR